MQSSASAGLLLRGPPVKQINEPSAELPGEKPCTALQRDELPTLTFLSLHAPPCGINKALTVKKTTLPDNSLSTSTSELMLNTNTKACA